MALAGPPDLGSLHSPHPEGGRDGGTEGRPGVEVVTPLCSPAKPTPPSLQDRCWLRGSSSSEAIRPLPAPGSSVVTSLCTLLLGATADGSTSPLTPQLLSVGAPCSASVNICLLNKQMNERIICEGNLCLRSVSPPRRFPHHAVDFGDGVTSAERTDAHGLCNTRLHF